MNRKKLYILGLVICLAFTSFAMANDSRGGVQFVFPDNNGHVETMDILDSIEISRADRPEVIARVRVVDSRRVLNLPAGDYLATINSHQILKTQKNFTITNQMVSLYLAFLYNYSTEKLEWEGQKVPTGKSFHVWTQKQGPFFIPLKKPDQELATFSLKNEVGSFYFKDSTLTHDGFQTCLRELVADQFLYDSEVSHALNNIPLYSASSEETQIVFPVGALRVNLPWGVTYSLTHLPSGKKVTLYEKCNFQGDEGDVTLFGTDNDFLLPIGRYVLEFLEEQRVLDLHQDQVLFVTR